MVLQHGSLRPHVAYGWLGSDHELWALPDGSMTVAYADDEVEVVCAR